MNMLLHGIKFKNFSIANGDTLEHDEFPDRTADTALMLSWLTLRSRRLGVPLRSSSQATTVSAK